MIQCSINNEYIIINKTAIQQRIEELDKLSQLRKGSRVTIEYHLEINILKQILSQSTPLIPEIEKAIQYGVKIESGNIRINYEKYSSAENQYISNLKLDI